MATKHGTLTANVATGVTHTYDQSMFAVTHHGNASQPIYVRFDGVTAVVAADNTHVVLPGQTKWFSRKRTVDPTDGTAISLICAGAASYSIELP